ncbi:hypothetical protein [Nitrospira sp. Kam-Ns4a]
MSSHDAILPVPRALAAGVALLLGLTLPAGAQDWLQGDDQRIVQVLTVDGTAVEGRVVGGILTVRTAAYDILTAGEDLIVWTYQGNRSRLTRVK